MRNHVGLLFEALAPETGELWNSVLQTSATASVIVAAMRLSKGWENAR